MGTDGGPWDECRAPPQTLMKSPPMMTTWERYPLLPPFGVKSMGIGARDDLVKESRVGLPLEDTEGPGARKELGAPCSLLLMLTGAGSCPIRVGGTGSGKSLATTKASRIEGTMILLVQRLLPGIDRGSHTGLNISLD